MTKCDEAPGPNYGQHCLHAYDDGVVCCWCGTGFDVDVPLSKHGHFAPKCPLDEYDCGNSYCETHHSQCAKGGQCWHSKKDCEIVSDCGREGQE